MLPRRAALLAVSLVFAVACSSSPAALSVRDQRWQADIAYLARTLPLVRFAGLGKVPRNGWEQAAARLEARVPELTRDQIVTGMAAMVTKLRDDETQLRPVPDSQQRTAFPVQFWWVSGRLRVVALAGTSRRLLGGTLTAIGGVPVARALARFAAVTDYNDAGSLRLTESFELPDPAYLSWLGLSTPTSVRLTISPVSGPSQTITLHALPHNAPPAAVAYIPFSLYLRNGQLPYWMTILSRQRAVYIRYNRCLDSNGFQLIARRALAYLRAHPSFRLIVDLRQNGGGDSDPFQTLIAGIRADPALNRPGMVFGLTDWGTASSATFDTYDLRRDTHAIIIGQPVSDPHDLYGNDQFFSLPWFGVQVEYTSSTFPWVKLGPPDIIVAPTVAQLLAGTDPVLARALAYPNP
jgi:hypothetical protein